MPRIADAKLRSKLRSLIAGVIVAAALGWPAVGAESAAVPNFSPDSRTGWIAGVPDGETPIGDDFLQPPSGPGPVTFDRAHPFIDNRVSRRLGKSATNRVADLSNPSKVAVESIEPAPAQAPAETSPKTESEDIAAVREKPTIPEATSPEPVEVPEPAAAIEPNAEPAEAQAAQLEAQEPAAAPSQEARELPRTGGELPLIALAGLLCVGAGLGLRILSAKS